MNATTTVAAFRDLATADEQRPWAVPPFGPEPVAPDPGVVVANTVNVAVNRIMTSAEHHQHWVRMNPSRPQALVLLYP
jgi:hypothetical protein